MKTKILECLKASAWGALTLFLLSGVVLFFQVSGELRDASLYARQDQRLAVQILTDADATMVTSQKQIQSLQVPITRAGALVNDARLAVDNANKAAIDERFYFEKALPPMLVHTESTLANVETVTAALPPLLQAATKRTQALAPIETNAATLIGDADLILKDPQILDALANVDKTSAELLVASRESAGMLASTQAMAADTEQRWHAFLHPHPFRAIGHWFRTTF